MWMGHRVRYVNFNSLCGFIHKDLLTVPLLYAVEAQTSLAPLSWFHGSRVTTVHAHHCCIFQSYAKNVPSRMELTMREPASMTTDTWSRRVMSDSNSTLTWWYIVIEIVDFRCIKIEKDIIVLVSQAQNSTSVADKVYFIFEGNYQDINLLKTSPERRVYAGWSLWEMRVIAKSIRLQQVAPFHIEEVAIFLFLFLICRTQHHLWIIKMAVSVDSGTCLAVIKGGKIV